MTEALITHGSDWIEWVDASGFVTEKKATPKISPVDLRVILLTAPQDLCLQHKSYKSVLWRKYPAELKQVINQIPLESDLVRPIETAYTLEGMLHDPAGQLLPRTFSLQAGNKTGHQIALYRSPMGSTFRSAGGIFGSIKFENGAAAAWTLITVTVTPPLGDTLYFIAQADKQGEFRLPLDRLPALSKDAPAQTYAAEMTIKAQPQPITDAPLDPDTLQPVEIAIEKTDGGISQFASTLDLLIKPGTVARVTSPKHPSIVLKST